MTNYGTLIDNQLQLAPRAIVVNGAMVTNPKAEHFAALNEERAKQDLPPYLPVRDEPPTCEEGYYAVATGWDSYGGAINRVYEVRELPPPPPRTFSKLRIVAALTQAGVWAQVKAYIEQAGLYDLYLAAQEFAEDNEYFAPFLAAIKTTLGIDDATAEAILSASVEGGV